MSAAEAPKQHSRAPIRSLAEHLRQGTFTAPEMDAGIVTGELFSEPFGARDWRERLRPWVMKLRVLDPADQRDLLMLSTLALEDGSLRSKLPDGRYAFHDEEYLAAALRVSVPTFRSRWNRWQAVGLVTTTGRPNRGRSERWLVPGGEKARELNAFPSSRGKASELKPFPSYKEVDSGGSPRASARGPRPLSKTVEREGRLQISPEHRDPPDCLRLGLDMLALGLGVQIIKPTGTVIEATRDDPGPLMRMLGSNNPSLAIAALISDKPSPGVLSGHEQPRATARLVNRPKAATSTGHMVLPLHRVLAALEDRGYRTVRKGQKWHSRCPAHNRSLSGSPSAPDSLEIRERPDGKVNLRCFKSCDWRLILGILGLTARDLYPQVTA